MEIPATTALLRNTFLFIASASAQSWKIKYLLPPVPVHTPVMEQSSF